LLHDHNSFLHIIGNLLGLFFLGRALLPVLGITRFLSVCGASLVTGGVFWLGVNWSHNDVLLGASAVVCGLFVVFATFNPDRPITLLLFFVLPVTLKPKTIALGLLAIDLCGLVFFELSGQRGIGIAHSAHLGGMAAGWIYARYLHDGDFAPFAGRRSIELPRWFRKAKKLDMPPPAYRVNIGGKGDMRAEIDRILDKINSEGFQSLTPDEKKHLDRARDHLSRR
jgi:membrane associated rhomboid family serine protease